MCPDIPLWFIGLATFGAVSVAAILLYLVTHALMEMFAERVDL